jgi:hypothetical protein
LVDLSGTERAGELLAMTRLVDSVIIVAKARSSEQRDLRFIEREVGSDKLVGVLLVGR